MVGFNVFFDLFSHSGLRAFFTNDFANCTKVYAQLSGAVHSIWWLGLIVVLINYFFDLFSHSGLRAFFSDEFTNCPTDYAPTIRCCSEHVMVGGFLLDLFSHSGLRAFLTNDFANCTTVYAQPSGAVHSIWWLGLIFFLTSSPILDLGHFSQVSLPIVLLIMPQVSGAVQSMWWLGGFFWPLLPFWT